jgi:hypothetical protein
MLFQFVGSDPVLRLKVSTELVDRLLRRHVLVPMAMMGFGGLPKLSIRLHSARAHPEGTPQACSRLRARLIDDPP